MTVLFSITVSAQRGIPRMGDVSVSSTIITKTKTKRLFGKYDAKVGYQHNLELNYNFNDISNIRYGISSVGMDYIGGWRFNNWLFIGGGIGIRSELSRADPNIKKHIGGTYTAFGKNGDGYHIDLRESLDIDRTLGTLNSYAIPLYVNVRTYLSRTLATPYLSLSAGGRFASKDIGTYMDLSGGVDFRINDRYHIFLSLGFWLSQYRDLEIGGMHTYYNDYLFYLENFDDVVITRYLPYEECDDNCMYSGIEYGHDHIDFHNLFKNKSSTPGVIIKLGLSF